MDSEPEDEIAGEVEISFVPRPQALADLGITLEDFEAAVLVALEAREALTARDDVGDDGIPPLEEMSLTFRGMVHKLEDLADVVIRHAVTDPAFGEIEFHVDAWDGVVPFEFAQSGTLEFAVHIWADPSGPTETQRVTFERLQDLYPSLWPSIAEALLVCHPGLISVEDVESSLGPTVGCHIEAVASEGHADFELVYVFDLAAENGRAFFVRVVGWRVVEAVLAE